MKKPSFRKVKRAALAMIDLANPKYYTSMAQAVCDKLDCNIVVRPSNEPDFHDQAQTFSRILNVKVVWPKKRSFGRVEHWIIFGDNMPPASAARCIAHELYHILAHDPTGGKRDVDEKTGFVPYTDFEEKAADIFSLALLKYRQYVKKRRSPLTSKQVLDLLKREAGKPSHLSWNEIKTILADPDF